MSTSATAGDTEFVQDLANESAAEIAARSPLELFWTRLKRDKVALVALAIVVFMVLVAILAPLIKTVFGLPDPNVQNENLLSDFGQPTGPSAGHPFGVDKRGRDVLGRVIYGSPRALVGVLLRPFL